MFGRAHWDSSRSVLPSHSCSSDQRTLDSESGSLGFGLMMVMSMKIMI